MFTKVYLYNYLKYLLDIELPVYFFWKAQLLNVLYQKKPAISIRWLCPLN